MYGDELISDYSGYKFLVDNIGKVTCIDDVDLTPANPPKLAQGMIPVKYNTQKQKWVICSSEDEEWYSYTTTDKKWANIMLCDGTYDESTPIGTEVAEQDLGSMFVWVPRYAYKITYGFHNSYGTLDLVWLKGKSYNYIDNKNVCTAKNGNEEDVTTNNAGYYVAHPAFTDGNTYKTFDNGEWRSEITGIWVAKFQAGFATTANDITRNLHNCKLKFKFNNSNNNVLSNF